MSKSWQEKFEDRSAECGKYVRMARYHVSVHQVMAHMLIDVQMLQSCTATRST